MTPRTLSILGATGSIGSSTLNLIAQNPHAYEVVALTAHRNVAKLAEAARATRAKLAVIAEDSLYAELRTALHGTGIECAAGAQALIEAAQRDADYTMAAIIGCAGLAPTMAAITRGKTVALANKEALVSAGDIMMQAAAACGACLLPVDSEHNAIFQCLKAEAPAHIARIILTASGGPFRNFTQEQLGSVTPAQALKHPNWEMGAKITIDSATMMNKGLELIEAYHLFPVAPAQLEVIIHPQSLIHSLVEFVDGSLLAQLGAADMRIPIAHTLGYPARIPTHASTPPHRLDFTQLTKLEFAAPDSTRFPCLRLAQHALEQGGALPCLLNAANEVAVAAFLTEQIGFTQIPALIEEVMTRLAPFAAPPAQLTDVMVLDAQARHMAHNLLPHFSVAQA
jgi:1-deoxy-D-xylulose-5-phosphate reductoisomerase